MVADIHRVEQLEVVVDRSALAEAEDAVVEMEVEVMEAEVEDAAEAVEEVVVVDAEEIKASELNGNTNYMYILFRHASILYLFMSFV